MEFSVDLTLSELGRDDDNGSRLFEAIQRVAPGTDPVLAGNFVDGLLSIVFAVDAADAAEALDRGRRLVDTGLAEAGLPMTQLVAVDVHLAEVAAPAA